MQNTNPRYQVYAINTLRQLDGYLAGGATHEFHVQVAFARALKCLHDPEIRPHVNDETIDLIEDRLQPHSEGGQTNWANLKLTDKYVREWRAARYEAFQKYGVGENTSSHKAEIYEFPVAQRA